MRQIQSGKIDAWNAAIDSIAAPHTDTISIRLEGQLQNVTESPSPNAASVVTDYNFQSWLAGPPIVVLGTEFSRQVLLGDVHARVRVQLTSRFASGPRNYTVLVTQLDPTQAFQARLTWGT